MANVAFKRGLSTALPQAGSAIDGVFYLTTDTNRLYVGNASKNLVDLNRYISVVADTTKLPTKPAQGDFVWVSAGNMLLVCVNPAGSNIQQIWTQINPPDTDTDTFISSASDATVNATAAGIDISFNLVQKALDLNETDVTDDKVSEWGDKGFKKEIPVSFTISAADLDAVLPDTKVGLSASAVTGGAKIATIGEGSDSSEPVNLKGGANVTVTVSGDDITISSVDNNTTYALSAEKVTDKEKVKLNLESSGDDDAVLFESKNDAIELNVTTGTPEVIEIKHKEYAAPSATPGAAQTPGHGGSFTIIDSVIADKGHITGYTTRQITLPTDNNTTYDLTALTEDQKAKIRLKNSDNANAKDDVTMAAGLDMTVTASGDVVTYGHAEYDTPSATSGTAIPATHGGKFTIIDDIAASNGHITGFTTREVTLPADNNTTNASADVSVSEGSITVKVTDSDETTVQKTATNVLYHKITVDGTEKTVYNQKSLGSFYSADEIDNKLNAVNAMVYKGTVGGTGATVSTLPASGNNSIQCGWTYKVAEKGTYGGHSCDVGDLLIASGTEKDGVIDGPVTWTYIPSGDDADTQHAVSVLDGEDRASIVLESNVEGLESNVTLVAGDCIDIEGNETDNTITISHELVDTDADNGTDSQSLNHSGTFAAISDVVVNEHGHVTGLVTKTYTLPSDNNTTYAISAANDSNKAKVTLTAGGTGSGTDNIYFAAGDGVSVNVSGVAGSETITYTHEEVDTDANNDTDTQTLNHSGTFSAISNVITNDRGHVTGLVTKTYTLPSDNNTTYDLDLEADHKIVLKGSDDTKPTVQFEENTVQDITDADKYIDLTDDVANQKIKIGHKKYSATTLNSAEGTATPLSHSGKFHAVTGVTRDSGGHITGVTTGTWQLPTDNNTTYAMSDHVVSATNNVATVTTTLTGSDTNVNTAKFDVASSTLQVSANNTTGNGQIAIDLVWGSFN